MGKQRRAARGRSRIVISAATTVGLMMAVSCVQNLSTLKAVQLKKLDEKLGCLEVEQEQLLVAVRVLSERERFQKLAMEQGWKREWGAERLYDVRPAVAKEPSLLAGVWRDAKDAVSGLVSTDAAYASER